MEKTTEAVLSLKNDFQGFESDRDQQWGMLREIGAALKELKEEVGGLAMEVVKNALREKQEEVERLRTEVGKKNTTWPNNIPTRPRRKTGHAVRKSEGISVKEASVETVEYCSNQQAPKEKEEERRKKERVEPKAKQE